MEDGWENKRTLFSRNGRKSVQMTRKSTLDESVSGVIYSYRHPVKNISHNIHIFQFVYSITSSKKCEKYLVKKILLVTTEFHSWLRCCRVSHVFSLQTIWYLTTQFDYPTIFIWDQIERSLCALCCFTSARLHTYYSSRILLEQVKTLRHATDSCLLGFFLLVSIKGQSLDTFLSTKGTLWFRLV